MSNKSSRPLIAICVPARDTCLLRFTNDIFNLALTECERHQLRLFPSEGCLVPSQRENLVVEALEAGASSILFLDTDMRFPPNLVTRLLSWERPIVAANCVDRRTGKHTAVFDAKQECISVGCAVMLIADRVFRKLQRPWFALPWDGNEKRLVGEDRYFCRKAREEGGFKILIDHPLSKQVRHVGLREYGIEDDHEPETGK